MILLLKPSKLFSILMSIGREFHSCGPDTASDLCSNVTLFVLGTDKEIISSKTISPVTLPLTNTMPLATELSQDLYHVDFLVNISLMYWGAIWWMPLYVNKGSLYLIWYSKRSQWRSMSNGVTWLNLESLWTSLAAMFWILCSLWIWYFSTPFNRPLQQSMWLKINAWISVSVAWWDKYFLILLREYSWQKDVLHLISMWVFIDIILSKYTLRFHTSSTAEILDSPTLILIKSIFANCWCEPIIMNSVFESFIWSLSEIIQDLTSSRQDSIWKSKWNLVCQCWRKHPIIYILTYVLTYVLSMIWVR